MARKSTVCPIHTENEKRSQAKLKRGRGQLAMKAKNMTEIEWCQSHDKLFRIKGIKRHMMLR